MAENNNKIVNSAEAEKKVSKKQEKKDKKPNFFARFFKKLGKFLKDTKGELKKVVWTSKSDVWKSFKLVIASVVAVSLAIAVIDYVSSFVINTIAGLIG